MNRKTDDKIDNEINKKTYFEWLGLKQKIINS